MTAFPKATQVVDPKYLAWCRAQPCFNVAECGRAVAGEAHHSKGKGMGGAIVRDDMAVPVCRRCHARCHGQKVDGLHPIDRERQKRAAHEARERYLARAGVHVEVEG